MLGHTCSQSRRHSGTYLYMKQVPLLMLLSLKVSCSLNDYIMWSLSLTVVLLHKGSSYAPASAAVSIMEVNEQHLTHSYSAAFFLIFCIVSPNSVASGANYIKVIAVRPILFATKM